jgi:hypothetical protein
MELPFSVEQFYSVFREYNTTLWPAQLLLVGLALVTIALVFFPRRWSGLAISTILAFLWAWLALAYHLAFFTSINPLAYVFSAMSLAGAVVFFWQGFVRRRLDFRWAASVRSWVGLVLIVFALIVYPAWSIAVRHSYPGLPTFGVPCPTTIFTIGLLAFLVRPYPRSPLVVPILWSFVGAQAVFLLGVPPDSGLMVAGVVGIVILVRSKVATVEGSARH